MMDRRSLLALAATTPFAASTLAIAPASAASATPFPIDPAAPVGGAPKGDVTIVAFFDYNCPYCKKAAPDLDRVTREDGAIRLVYIDWPILTKASVYGALVALAAKRQGKYEAVYRALLSIPGSRVEEEAMRAALPGAGVDLARLQRDVDAHKDALFAQIRRNAALADRLGLQGTPSYVIGAGVASVLDAQGFRAAVAQARAGRGG
jgi:protein-disulfide isomerase